MKAIRIHATGGIDAMRIDDLPSPQPKAGEVLLRVEAVGVNFIDTYRRGGLYPVPLPHTLGQEAAGTVIALGPGVTAFDIGDRVVSASVKGAYAGEAVVDADQCVRVPAGVSAETAAAVFVQGLTAHYLAIDTFPLRPGHTALIHAAAGGVGLLLVQLAVMRGARVIATAGTDDKATLARAAGAEAVCVYSRDDFIAAALAFTGGRGVDVVYDGVGRATFEGSLGCLRPRGMLVSFGNASGPVPPFAPLLLAQKGSLFFTRPTLADYLRAPGELVARAGDLFRWIAQGRLHVRVGARYALSEASEAHRVLESRETVGKVLLLP